MYVPLPKLTPDGYRVIVLYISDEARNMEPSPFSHFLKATFMTIDILGKFDYPKGVIIVNDGKNVTKKFVTTAASEFHKLIALTMVNIIIFITINIDEYLLEEEPMKNTSVYFIFFY